MSQFIEVINNKNNLDSVAFYFGVVILATLFAFGTQIRISSFSGVGESLVLKKRHETIIKDIQLVCLAVSFFLLWFTLAFADCGTDREEYGRIFSNVSFSDLTAGWQEPGFIIFNMIFRIFGDEPRIIYIAMSTLTLLLLYRTWYVLRGDISIGFAVLAYSTLFFVQSLSPMRIHMASAILFSGINFLRDKKYLNYALVILLATLIHYSSLLMFFPLIVIVLLENHKYKQYVHVVGIIVGLIVIGICIISGASILQNITIFARFQRYLESVSFQHIGIMQFAYNLPICALVFFSIQYVDIQEKRIMVAYAGSAFLMGILSYGIPVFGRTSALFSILYMFIIPKCMKSIKMRLWGIKNRGKAVYLLLCLFWMIYFLFRFTIYLGEYGDLESIIPYDNIFL